MKKTRRPIAAAVASAALLPLMIGGAQVSAADPVPPADAAAGSSPAVPLEGLVPGIPPTSDERHIDTPDQALPPVPSPSLRPMPAPAAWRPSYRQALPNPPSAARRDMVVEYVPPALALPSRTARPPKSCTAPTGPYQREVERFLGLKVDGKQSRADCIAIRKWQIEEDIEPAVGFAGPSSWGWIRLDEAWDDPNADGDCPVIDDVVACVDLPRQLMWVQDGDEVIYGPVPIRSGKAGYPTRTGWHRIYWRHKDHVSTIYDSPMPFSQFFNGGQALHGVYGNIYDPDGGSYGCVNLRYRDAEELWDVLYLNDRVYAWGRRPGT